MHHRIPENRTIDAMQLTKYLPFILIFLSFYCYSADSREIVYSSSFLKNYKAVRTYLLEIGFKKIRFETSDNLTLTGLFLSRPNATHNVIVCAGWLPGKKEGMATFYDILPDCCNILFFDARGRGESDGYLFWNSWRYGIDEYKDVIAAISWINDHNALPIIIGGTCSGVFNAAHAIINLIQNNALEQSHVKGLFFDSGWGSVMTMSQSSAIANIKKYISRNIVSRYRTQKNTKENILYKACCSFFIYCFKALHYVSAQPLIIQYEKITNLFDKIDQISIPVFFIHSYDDTHATFSNVRKLAALTPCKQCWWIDKSSHAKHHIIHRDSYKEKLRAFIDDVLSQ